MSRIAPAIRPSRVCAALAVAFLLLVAPAAAHAAQVAGVQTHLLWDGVDAAQMDRQLDAARDAGAGMVRVDIGWGALEPDAKGQWSTWYLGRVDDVVQKANARGLKVLFTFWQTPCWASSAPDSVKQGCDGAWWGRGVENYAPVHASDYADALAFLVRRYGSRVAAWEIWNEPNSGYYFKADDPVASYAGLVKAAYPAAKAADPGTTVVAGSLMWADYDFTDQLYQHGIKGFFDALSIHPYSDDRSPLDPGVDPWKRGSFLSGVPAVHAVEQRYGDDKPLWLTEFGWTTSSVRNAENWQNGVDGDAQARYVTQALTQMRRWPYVQVAIYYGLIDTGSDPQSSIDNYGLLREDFTPKPAYAAFRSAAAALGGGPLAPAPAAVPGGPAPSKPADGPARKAPAGSSPTPRPSVPAHGTRTHRNAGKRRTGAHARVALEPRHHRVIRIRKGAHVRALHVRRTRSGLRVRGRAAPHRRVVLRVYRAHRRRPVARRAVRAGRHGRFESSVHRRGLRHRRVLRVVARAR